MDTEAIYAALFNQLKDNLGTQIKTYSRKLKAADEIAPADQPALFQVQGNQVANAQTKLPNKWTLFADLFLYVHTEGTDAQAPTELLNPLRDAIVDVIEPDTPTMEQTLGGLVHSCRINGTLEIFDGALGEQAIAVIPVEIIVTP